MATRGHGRRRSSHDEVEHENEERWLLTYADMITLLMTLFMVLFAISSVNTSKFEALEASLSEALSGKIVTGGGSIQETGATEKTEQPAPEPPFPAIEPVVQSDSSTSKSASASSNSSRAAAHENEDFRELKRKIDAYAQEHGLQDKLETHIVRRGLVIRLLTDRVLYASGSARLQPASTGLLSTIARLLVLEVRHPIVVEGHTDNHPISSARFPTNWELSTARATQVVRFFIDQRLAARRLQAAGVAAQRPIASNSNDAGRSRNRRVEIVLLRLNPSP
ncbi:MAG: flagellar motor protein MotB [Solirubrobacteraceae bacterium]